MHSPWSAWAASIQASEKVGWAWIVSPSSRAVSSARMAVAAAAINSVACGPTAAAPSSWSVVGVGDPFDEPRRLSSGKGLAEAREAKLAGLDRAVLSGSACFAQADGRRLRAR